VAREVDPVHPRNDHDPKVSRRDFIGRAAVATAAVVGAAVVGGAIVRTRDEEQLWDEDAFRPPGQARVAVVPRTSYTGNLTGVVLDGLRAIGADVSGARVLLKPNLVEYDPGSVINTDPRLVAATVEAVRRLGGASVSVAEGPGHRRDTTYVMRASGLMEALHDVDSQFIDLNVAPATPVGLRSRYTPLGTLWIPHAVRDADVVISMPKMKTHHWAGVTLSLKNCFGCLPGRVYGWPKNALHWVGIDNAIVDVAGAVRPSYAIIDGIVGIAQAQVGNLVNTTSGPLTTVSTVDPIKVYFTVSEQEYLKYSNVKHSEADQSDNLSDLELQLVLADGSMYPERGRFYFADRQVDPKTGAIRMAGVFPNAGNVLRPGQYGRVRAVTKTREDALLVPQRAVTELQGTYQVAVVGSDNKVSIRPVKVSDRSGSMWIVEEGLKSGEVIVAEGALKVRPGMVVDPKPFTGNPELAR